MLWHHHVLTTWKSKLPVVKRMNILAIIVFILDQFEQDHVNSVPHRHFGAILWHHCPFLLLTSRDMMTSLRTFNTIRRKIKVQASCCRKKGLAFRVFISLDGFERDHVNSVPHGHFGAILWHHCPFFPHHVWWWCRHDVLIPAAKKKINVNKDHVNNYLPLRFRWVDWKPHSSASSSTFRSWMLSNSKEERYYNVFNQTSSTCKTYPSAFQLFLWLFLTLLRVCDADARPSGRARGDDPADFGDCRGSQPGSMYKL